MVGLPVLSLTEKPVQTQVWPDGNFLSWMNEGRLRVSKWLTGVFCDCVRLTETVPEVALIVVTKIPLYFSGIRI